MSNPSERTDYRALLKRAYLSLDEMQARLDAVEQAKREPIAIIGLGCRFPGGASTPAAYWELLRTGGDAIVEVPPERWDIDAYYDPNLETPGKMSTRWGGFLDQVDQFDPEFFGISPREVITMDPQQRLFLEVVWEALENAGLPVGRLAGSRTGVFAGICSSDYSWPQFCDPVYVDTYASTGTAYSILANRVSHLFDFQGPSVAVDTACSSSLVTTHLACQSLRNNECDLAFAGGVSLMLFPEGTVALSRYGMLSPDGRCKTFDASANGFTRGEGCGVIVLKRLSDAQRDGDRILALIRGSAVNQDGRSVGLTAPNALAQQAVIRQALANALLEPGQVSYVEAHGTGTPLGDPIEIGSLKEVYGQTSAADHTCLIGSVKTNIGHLEAAAGVAGVIKVVLALQHNLIPPHLHLKALNPHISFDGTPFAIPTAPQPWPANGGPRIAGVSSFGFGGTNAHVLLEEAPAQEITINEVERPYHLLVLSARSAPALQELADRIAQHIGKYTSDALADICYTINIGRSHFNQRLAVVAATADEMRERLDGFARHGQADSQNSAIVANQGSPKQRPKIAFLFTGQGSQYRDMGRQLYDTQPTFRQTLDRCAELLAPHLAHPLLEVLFPADDDDRAALLDQTAYTQPALFALEYALAELWKSWGIVPDVVLGHSVGEYVAACVAGVFSLEDGLTLIAARGRLMQALPAGGAMAALFAPVEYVQPMLEPYSRQVSLAALNGPTETVISGEQAAIDAILEQCAAQEIKTRRLVVSHAFHSPLMEPMLEQFACVAAEIEYATPRLKLISNVTGELLKGKGSVDAVYWRRHVREPVQFLQSIQTVHAQGCDLFVEVGPKPTLLGMARTCLPEGIGVWLPSLRKDKDDWEQLLGSLGALYVQGATVDWTGFERDYVRQQLLLPTYPFQRERFWLEDPRPALRGLIKAERQKVEQKQLRNWFYEVGWLPQPSLEAEQIATTWLIFADQGGLGAALSEHLIAQNANCTLVFAAPPGDPPATAYQVCDPASVAEMQQLVQQARAAAQSFAVLHLWNLDAPAAADLTTEALDEAQYSGCGSLLHLAQALAQTGGTPARLWVVTRGAQAITPADVNAAHMAVQSTVWGLGRVIAAEHPDLWGGLIDLDSNAAAHEQVAALAAELALPPAEPQRALRAGERFVARLVRKSSSSIATPSLTVRDDASYLVTGGLGALGLHVAHWLVEQGARALVLVGRRAPSETAQQAIAALESAGASVLVFQGDVSRESDVAALLACIAAEMPPLRGIIHTAGVLDDGVLLQQNWQRFSSVLAPKVQGAWHLHTQTQNQPLDFFVLFSSAAAVLGPAGQSSYAAANAFLDALAHYRRTHGLPAVSLNWGPWSEAGMAAQTAQQGQRRWEAQGVQAITPAQGLSVLEMLAQQQQAQVIVLSVAWETFLQQFAPDSIPPLFAELARTVPKPASAEPAAARRSALLQQLADMPPTRHREIVLTHIRATVSGVLGFSGDRPLDTQQGLFDMGLDSLMAVELRNRLQNSVGESYKLPSTLIFDYPTIDALTNYLVGDVLAPSVPVTVQERHAAIDEPIAIVGLSCRFPGGANSPQAFWQLLREGVDAIGEVPPGRWDVEAYFDPDPDVPGKIYTRYGGFLQNIDLFDAHFFGIAPREAISLDPQQRLLLEVVWEALEYAGQAPDKLLGTQTGVFVGISSNDYAQLQIRSGDPANVNAYYGTGNALSAAAGRLSYLLGLQGPAIAVDTACSSSLVSVHLACQSLRSGECHMALAGGVNLVMAPETNINLSKARMMAPDGRCKTFDASANGYVRSEGCGMVVLKRLSDAQRDRDTILALIRGSAVNQDGRSVSLTAPNGPSQELVIRQALASAGVETQQISYVEAHGTGTPLGDPIEIQAMAAVLSVGRTPEHPLLVGSVKTNVGHLESAAGIAGLLKVVLSLQHQQIPPHLHLREPNPLIPWAELPVCVPTECTPWTLPNGHERRVAGVSSFGFIGTNAHVIVEEAPERESVQSDSERPHHLLTLSARSKPALHALIERFAAHLAGEPSQSLANICFTANSGRSHFSQRVALVAQSAVQMGERLAALSQSQEAAGVVWGEAAPGQRPKIAFLFTGQGSQYRDMGRQLYKTQPTFRQTLDRCADLLAPHLERPLLEILFPADDDCAALLDQTAYTQPALFALEYALAELWRSWGIVPDVVLGHSVGEYVAACVAGVMCLEDSLTLIAARGRLMQALPASGAMAALFAPVEQVQPILEPYRGQVSLAALNGPTETVISGEQAAVETILEQCATQEIKTRRLMVSHAFHSPLMEPMLEQFAQLAGTISYAAPQIALVSNLTGELVTSECLLDAAYWRRHVREPVQFAASIQTAYAQGCTLFVEVGPKPTLLGMASNCLPEEAGVWLPSLRKDKDDWEQLLGSVGALYVQGTAVDWVGFERDYVRQRVPLPTYPFQRQRYWLEIDIQKQVSNATFVRNGADAHPLLGYRLRSALRDILFENIITATTPAFIADHKIYDVVVVPGACHIAMVLAAAEKVFKHSPYRLEDITFAQALVLPEDAQQTVQLILSPHEQGGSTFQVLSSATDAADDETGWTLHARGRLRTGHENGTAPAAIDLEAIRARCPEKQDSVSFYRGILERDIQLGPGFQWISHVWRRDGEALGLMQLPATVDDADRYALHPGLVDSCFQLTAAAVAASTAHFAAVPLSLERYTLYQRPGNQLWCHMQLQAIDEGGTQNGQAQSIIRADAWLFDEQGQPVAEIGGLAIKRAPREVLLADLQLRRDDWLYELVWQPVPPQAANTTQVVPQHWLIFADQGGVGETLAGHLSAVNAQCKLVYQSLFDATDLAAFRQLVVQSDDTSDAEGLGVVHLWNLDTPAGAALADPDVLNVAQQAGCGSVLHLLQALAWHRSAVKPRLYLVTGGAQVILPADSGAVAQSAVWGLGRVIGSEHPDMLGGLIDLDPQASAHEQAATLAAELTAASDEPQRAIRNQQRYVARLLGGKLAGERQSVAPTAVREDGSYLITGGLGGLGLRVVRWLAEQGARHLVLLGRSAPSDTARAVLAELEQAGVTVLVAQADISQVEQVAHVLDTICKNQPALRGIVHAAGVLDDGVLLQQDWMRFQKVMAPKVQGAWHLHTLTREHELDFFVLFSSAAALLAPSGQGTYAAANAFLDGLAHHRRAQGMPALSLNWGPWSEVGMAAQVKDAGQRRWEAQGIRPVTPEQGLAALDRLLRGYDGVQMMVLPVVWSTFFQQFASGAEPALFAELARTLRPQMPATQPAAEQGKLIQVLEKTPPARQRDVVLAHIREQITSVMGLEPNHSIAPQQKLFDMGMDSLMAVELRNRLQNSVGATLPSTFIFDYPSLEKLADYLLKNVLVHSLPGETAEATTEERTGGELDLLDIEQLSEEEVMKLFAEKLAQE